MRILKVGGLRMCVGNRIALIGIIVEDIDAVARVNDLLHEYSPMIVGRMGIPYRENRISIISVAVDGAADDINSLSGKLGDIKGISVKTMYTKFGENTAQ